MSEAALIMKDKTSRGRFGGPFGVRWQAQRDTVLHIPTFQ